MPFVIELARESSKIAEECCQGWAGLGWARLGALATANPGPPSPVRRQQLRTSSDDSFWPPPAAEDILNTPPAITSC